MSSGKYFNRGVMALDAPYIGYVARETQDKLVVFGEQNKRYEPKTEIQTTGRNVLIGLNISDIEKKYKVKREDPLPTSRPTTPWTQGENIDLASYERKYPKTLFNKGVRTENEEDVVVFGHHDYRYDIPKSKIIAVGMNVILGMNPGELLYYKVDKNAPLPTGEPIDKVADEE